MNRQQIRNFCIVAHIDHGKSTLADRFLEITGTVSKEKLQPQHLDQNPIERERGITIKLAPVRMRYILNSELYILNLIDTPGHVDFSYEVSRSLACVEGAILLVDATSGIQAQTVSNVQLALSQNLVLIPVVNKIDLPNAQKEKTAQDLIDTFGFSNDEILFISAKTGEHVEELLEAIVTRIPHPKGEEEASLKALIFDSQYDQFKGVLAFIRIFDGTLATSEEVLFMREGLTAQTVEVGLFLPVQTPVPKLTHGEIGYVATGLKDVSGVRVGDTITGTKNKASSAIAGYREVKPMVFAAFYPVDGKDFPLLSEALAKLRLNDASFSFEPEHSDALGAGLRIGFLGVLHMEVVQERLEREYGLALIASTPTVGYFVETTKGDRLTIERPAKLPDSALIKRVKEPYVSGKIITPKGFLGPLLTLINAHRGLVSNMEYQGEQVTVIIDIPLSEIIVNFYDRLKNVSSGFASFEYELSGMREVSIVKLEILVAKKSVDALSQIVVAEKAQSIGRALIERLKEVIPRQQFEVSLQAAIGSTIIARADVPAFRKDVTAKLYGGDRTRKDKLLEAQKKGKRRMKMVGNVAIPQEAFLSVLKL